MFSNLTCQCSLQDTVKAEVKPKACCSCMMLPVMTDYQTIPDAVLLGLSDSFCCAHESHVCSLLFTENTVLTANFSYHKSLEHRKKAIKPKCLTMVEQTAEQ